MGIGGRDGSGGAVFPAADAELALVRSISRLPLLLIPLDTFRQSQERPRHRQELKARARQPHPPGSIPQFGGFALVEVALLVVVVLVHSTYHETFPRRTSLGMSAGIAAAGLGNLDMGGQA